MNKRNRWGWLGVASLVLATGGCSWILHPAKESKALARSVEGTVGIKTPTNVLAFMQRGVMREADGYVSLMSQAADDLAAKVGTTEMRIAALEWKLHQATAAFVVASGENPALNAVDMVVLASFARMVVEDYWVGQKYGQVALPLLEVHRKLEQNAWSVVEQELAPAQQKELRQLILEWRQHNPNQRYVGAVRLREFTAVLGNKAFEGQAAKPNSVLNLLNIDPFSGIDPAVRAVEQTRYLAERMMYYVERAPMLLNWQVEALTYQVAQQPAPQQVLSNMTSLSRSAEVFAHTAEQLPKLVNDQRQAAIDQMFAGIATERSNIIASLETQESKLRELLPEARQTLATAGDMGNSLDGAIKSLDAFIHYVSPPQTNPAPQSTNSHPFNVLEFGQAASEIGAMSRDLNALLASANQNATQLAALSAQAGATAERAVDRAFRLGLLLVLVLLVGSVLAGLAYRALANRLTRGPRHSA